MTESTNLQALAAIFRAADNKAKQERGNADVTVKDVFAMVAGDFSRENYSVKHHDSPKGRTQICIKALNSDADAPHQEMLIRDAQESDIDGRRTITISYGHEIVRYTCTPEAAMEQLGAFHGSTAPLAPKR
jgi:hypothetical protein